MVVGVGGLDFRSGSCLSRSEFSWVIPSLLGEHNVEAAAAANI